MFAIRLLKKSELHWEPFAVLTDEETLSTASWQKQQHTPFINMIF